MGIQQTDRLGRATFHHIEPRIGVRPTEREIRWLKHIERHGPQSSEFLFELTRDTHRCKDTALRDMQKLRAGGYLRLPRQQRATERAEFQSYIYDLTKQSQDYLKSLGIAEKTIRPTGHWWHAYAISAVTSTLDTRARRRGREFIPAHKILERNGAELGIPIGGKWIIPDQLFAVRYADGFRAFLLEVDRATEPLRSSHARKSLIQSVDLYAEMFARDLHRRHYGLKSSTAVLYVFTNPSRLAVFQRMVQERAGPLTGRFLCKALPERLTWESLDELHQRPWLTGGGQEVAGL
ncbi:hypothetical protein DDZ14_02765 [Maritimibacter sp. 55A14]|uniref:replication-relaxation family protein n=1 Tax=Maritimibacter sp. 55A14 TaxID=2174844 RepID=UPI000D60F578|nr:replication-relaxation family protein [Maritimibacter sp. 55A14]PWE34096.1 hypothetical protein DDZ14_02765 [Maritimibacter sp. 55A14]